MGGLPGALFDPYLVMLPDRIESAEQFERFVLGLIGWSEGLRRPDVKVFMSHHCMDGLFADGWIPYTGKLAPLLRQYQSNSITDVPIINERTLVRLAQAIFEKTPALEERVGIKEVVVDEAQTMIEPAVFVERLSPATSRGLRDSLIILALSLQYRESMVDGCMFASMPPPSIHHPGLAIRARIELAESISGQADHDIDSLLPVDVSTQLELCVGFDDYRSRIDSFALWNGAESEGGARDAILALVHRHSRSGPAPRNLRPSYMEGLTSRNEIFEFRLGRQFLAASRKYGFHSKSDLAINLLDSCARILLGMPKNEVDEFRADERPQAPQKYRVADGARAWRTHLTSGHEGFRLMFWTTPDGIVEFANVGPKKELIILE
jgi:hypothetical protein